MNQSTSFLLITILIISGLSIGMWNFFSELSDKYQDTRTEPITDAEIQMIRNINYTTKVYEDVTKPLEEKIVEASKKDIFTSIIDFFVGSVVTGVLFLVNIPGIIINFISVLTTPLALVLGLDSWVFTMVNAIISLFVIIVIIRIIMKWKF